MPKVVQDNIDKSYANLEEAIILSGYSKVEFGNLLGIKPNQVYSEMGVTGDLYPLIDVQVYTDFAVPIRRAIYFKEQKIFNHTIQLRQQAKGKKLGRKMFIHQVDGSTNSSGNIINNNLYFSSLPASEAGFVSKGVHYIGYSLYQSKSGQDKDSKYLDPKFVSLSPTDFRLQASSPAIDAGFEEAPSILGLFDFLGAARINGISVDIGAIEYR